MTPATEMIVIGSDHAAYSMKEFIKKELEKYGIPYKDVGTNTTDSVDYPVYAGRVARAVAAGEFSRGIALCGTGIGASMTANRFKKVRAALCITEEMARMSRQHNNANVLVLGARITTPETIAKILRIWLETPFDGGRHENRIAMLDEIDK
jgi:ribose 5-phosphate isomerase B